MSEIMICSNCGDEYKEGAKFCIKCGSPLVKMPDEEDKDREVDENLIYARRAKEKEDWWSVERYYTLVEQSDPSNIEAIFYCAYGKAKNSLVDPDIFRREEAFNVLYNCVSMIEKYYSVEKEDELKETIQQISEDIYLMVKGSYVYNQKKNGFGVVVSSEKKKTIAIFNRLEIEFSNVLSKIIEKYPDNDRRTITYYDMAISHMEHALSTYVLDDISTLQEKVKKMHNEWNRIDSRHTVPMLTPGPIVSMDNDDDETSEITQQAMKIGGIGTLIFFLCHGSLSLVAFHFFNNALGSMFFEALTCIIAMAAAIFIYEKGNDENCYLDSNAIYVAVFFAMIFGVIVSLIIDNIPVVRYMGILRYIIHLLVFAIPGYVYLDRKEKEE